MRVLSDVLVGRAREAAAVAEKAASEALSTSQAALLLIDAFAVRDWARLEASYHPDALITSIAGGTIGPGADTRSMQSRSRKVRPASSKPTTSSESSGK